MFPQPGKRVSPVTELRVRSLIRDGFTADAVMETV